MGICPKGDAERACEAKVGELEVAVLIDEQVLRLEVAVENAVRVKVVAALYKLVRLRRVQGGRQWPVPLIRVPFSRYVRISTIAEGRGWGWSASVAFGGVRGEARTWTMSGPSPSPSPTLSMYRLRSMSRNSMTRYSFEIGRASCRERVS